MKRMLSVLCCLALMISLMPMSALADVEKGVLITDLKLSMEAPAVGETLKFVGETPEGANYTITEQEWYDPSIEEPYAADTVYEYRAPYRYDLVLKAKDGYYFDESVDYTIDGVEWYDVRYYVYDDETMGLFCYWNDDNSEDDVEETVKINLSGYNTKVGQYVTQKWGSLVGDPRFYVDENWYETENYDYYDGKFESGKQYAYSLVLTANDGFGFAEDSEITIDGIEFDEAYCTVDYNFYIGRQELCFTALYTPIDVPEGEEDKAVTDLNLTLDEPVLGGTLQFIGELPEDAPFTIEEECWYDTLAEYEGPLDTNTVYKKNYSYVYEVVLKAKEGFYFEDSYDYAIDGVEWLHEDSSISLSHDYFHIRSYFAILDDSREDNVVETVKINLSGYNTKAGKPAILVSESLPEDPRYHVFYEVWIDESTGYEVEGDFEAGKTYRYDIWFVANDGFEFADDSELMFDDIEFTDTYLYAGYNIGYLWSEILFSGYFTPVEADEEPVEEPSEPQTEAPESEPQTEAPETEPQTQAPESETQAPAQPESSSAASAAVPETGDGNPVGMLVLLLGISAVGVLAVASRKRRA